MKKWERDKAAADFFTPEIIGIVTGTLVTVATKEEDEEQNTDLMWIGMGV